jgi:hypothetical protein
MVTSLIVGAKGVGIAVLCALFAGLGGLSRSVTTLMLTSPVAYWLFSNVREQLESDVELFTSVATRMGMGLTAAMTILHNPVGVGFYGFYPAFAAYGTAAADIVSTQTQLATRELETIVGDLVMVSSKSTLLDYVMVFGLPFVFLLVRVLRMANWSDPRARFALVFLLISAASTSGHMSITFFAGIAIVARAFPGEKSKNTFGATWIRRQVARLGVQTKMPRQISAQEPPQCVV